MVRTVRRRVYSLSFYVRAGVDRPELSGSYVPDQGPLGLYTSSLLFVVCSMLLVVRSLVAITCNSNTCGFFLMRSTAYSSVYRSLSHVNVVHSLSVNVRVPLGYLLVLLY